MSDSTVTPPIGGVTGLAIRNLQPLRRSAWLSPSIVVVFSQTVMNNADEGIVQERLQAINRCVVASSSSRVNPLSVSSENISTVSSFSCSISNWL